MRFAPPAWLTAALLGACLAVACGGDADTPREERPGRPSTVAAAAAQAEDEPEPTERFSAEDQVAPTEDGERLGTEAYTARVRELLDGAPPLPQAESDWPLASFVLRAADLRAFYEQLAADLGDLSPGPPSQYAADHLLLIATAAAYADAARTMIRIGEQGDFCAFFVAQVQETVASNALYDGASGTFLEVLDDRLAPRGRASVDVETRPDGEHYRFAGEFQATCETGNYLAEMPEALRYPGADVRSSFVDASGDVTVLIGYLVTRDSAEEVAAFFADAVMQLGFPGRPHVSSDPVFNSMGVSLGSQEAGAFVNAGPDPIAGRLGVSIQVRIPAQGLRAIPADSYRDAVEALSEAFTNISRDVDAALNLPAGLEPAALLGDAQPALAAARDALVGSFLLLGELPPDDLALLGHHETLLDQVEEAIGALGDGLLQATHGNACGLLEGVDAFLASYDLAPALAAIDSEISFTRPDAAARISLAASGGALTASADGDPVVDCYAGALPPAFPSVLALANAMPASAMQAASGGLYAIYETPQEQEPISSFYTAAITELGLAQPEVLPDEGGTVVIGGDDGQGVLIRVSEGLPRIDLRQVVVFLSGFDE